MTNVFGYEQGIMLVLFFVLLAVKIFALVNSLMYPSEAYQAAGKATKPAWTIGLGLAVAFQLVAILPFFINIAFTIAALVFLADVRPALSSLRRR